MMNWSEASTFDHPLALLLFHNLKQCGLMYATHAYAIDGGFYLDLGFLKRIK